MNLTLTEVAQNKIATAIKSRGKGIGVRIGVKTTGCSGLAYVLEFIYDTSKIEATDDLVDTGEFKIVIDAKSKIYLEGMAVDYVEEQFESGFKFINPNEKARCGCGESFTV